MDFSPADIPATLALVAANVLISLYAFSARNFAESHVFHVGPLRSGQWWRLVTPGFLHTGMFHLFINMFVLLQFGSQIEAVFGTGHFLIFYAASLLGGHLWALLENWRKPDYRAVGASGAISGLVIIFAFLAPNQELYLFAILPMRAWMLAALFIVVSALLSQRPNKVIGHEAHLGGALAGGAAAAIMYPQLWDRFLTVVAASLGGGA